MSHVPATNPGADPAASTGGARVGLLTQVSAAHLVSHFHIMAVPAVLPLLPAAMGVGFVEIGIALAVFNVISAFVQAPLGFAVDRFGARQVLLAGLALGSASFVALAAAPTFTVLVVAMALAGIANGVYHPADYALLSRGIADGRMGRAFSIHTFAGYLGSAIAPAILMTLAGLANLQLAFGATALIGLVAFAIVRLPSRDARHGPGPRPARQPSATTRATAPATGSLRSMLTPAILVLTLLFVLLNLSVSAIERFSVSALVRGFDVPLPWANAALTAFLFASAFGVLSGGALADRTRRHGFVAAAAFAVAAALVAIVALVPLPLPLLAAVLGTAGFLTGLIAPSRDMLVRAAARPGTEGKTFGIVMTGFNIGGAAGPVAFGWLLDHGRYAGIFWASVGFMLLTVLLTLSQEWRARAVRLRMQAATDRGPSVSP
jgi:FSR family fosmidomycin resistance protein-like MFS transporter